MDNVFALLTLIIVSLLATDIWREELIMYTPDVILFGLLVILAVEFVKEIMK